MESLESKKRFNKKRPNPDLTDKDRGTAKFEKDLKGLLRDKVSVPKFN